MGHAEVTGVPEIGQDDLIDRSSPSDCSSRKTNMAGAVKSALDRLSEARATR